MIVALHITSESGDHYLELYKDKTVSEIYEDLREGDDGFYGCSIRSKVLDGTAQEMQELVEMLRDFEEESWNFC